MSNVNIKHLLTKYNLDQVVKTHSLSYYNTLDTFETFYRNLINNNELQYDTNDLLEEYIIYRYNYFIINKNKNFLYTYTYDDINYFLNNLEKDLHFLDNFLYKNGKELSFMFKHHLKMLLYHYKFFFIILNYHNQDSWKKSHYIYFNNIIKKFIDYNLAHLGIDFNDFIENFSDEYYHKKNLKLIFNSDFDYDEIYSSKFSSFFKENSQHVNACVNNAKSILENLKNTTIKCIRSFYE